MEMRTKQEVIKFLESKVGTKVVCVGNTKLNGECVTLIKNLMDFLGVPDPYKARGHAKTCISSYINEGIAKQGMGFLSVFSNKDMGGGYGHIWCNAGDGDGVFYESNGVKPLTVTKGKTYTYDAVCNFDSYITSDSLPEASKELAECNIHKNNLQNQVNGLLKDIEDQKGVISDTETKLGTANGRIQELTKQNESLSSELGSVRADLKTALESAKTAKEALQKELSDQLDYGDKWETEQEAHNITKSKLDALLWDMEDTLKLSHTSTDIGERIFVALVTLGKLHQTITVYEDKVKALESEVKKLTTQSRHISKLTIKDCIIILIDKIKEKYGKK